MVEIFGLNISRKQKKMQTAGMLTLNAVKSIQATAGDGTKNKYEQYRNFMLMDPELYGAVNRLALMCEHAYKGMSIDTGKELEQKEKDLLKLCNKISDKFDYGDLFYTIGFDLLQDGDSIWVSTQSKTGIDQIKPLPIVWTTITEVDPKTAKSKALATVDPPGDTSVTVMEIPTEPIKMIQEANFYNVNEGTKAVQVFPENEQQKVWHVGLNNRNKLVKDILKRLTFGIWSISPLETLKSRVLWKQAILLTDVLMRQRNLPREVHELDLSWYIPDNFEGATHEDRVEKAREALDTALDEYSSKFVKGREPHEAYFVNKGNKIYTVGGDSSGTYLAPNELADQINRSHFSALSAPESGVIGRGTSTFASELVVLSYAVLLPERLVKRIKRMLIEFTKLYITSNEKESKNYNEEDLDKIGMKTSLILDIMRGELARIVAVLAATGIADEDELRKLLDWGPLTEEQRKRIIDTKGKGRGGESYAQTPDDIKRDFVKTTVPGPGTKETPESRADKQDT